MINLLGRALCFVYGHKFPLAFIDLPVGYRAFCTRCDRRVIG